MFLGNSRGRHGGELPLAIAWGRVDVHDVGIKRAQVIEIIIIVIDEIVVIVPRRNLKGEGGGRDPPSRLNGAAGFADVGGRRDCFACAA
jgi:hypothetical protein